MTFTVLIVGPFLSWFFMGPSSSAICYAWLGFWPVRRRALPSQILEGKRAASTPSPTAGCPRLAAMETGSSSNRSQRRLESAHRRRELCHGRYGKKPACRGDSGLPVSLALRSAGRTMPAARSLGTACLGRAWFHQMRGPEGRPQDGSTMEGVMACGEFTVLYNP